MTHEDPYAPRNLDLGPCALRTLTPEAAALLAPALAALDPWRTLGYGEAGLLGYLSRPDPALRRSELRAGEELCGVVCVRHPWLRGPYLELLCVLPPFQGRGLGNAAMGWFEDLARDGGGNAWALVSAFNGPARRFYGNRGYAEVADLPGLAAEGFDEILLRKRLSPG